MRNLFIILLFFVSVSISATTYYVATNGDDSRTTVQAQNINTPWLTWQHAIDNMASGDTIFVRGGVYYLSGVDPWVVINPTTNHGENGGGVNSRSFFGTYPADYTAGNPAILDCNNATTQYATNYSAFGVEYAQYWHIKGIMVRNAWQRDVSAVRAQGIGGTTSASIVFENCTTHDITGRGFYFESGAWNTWDGPDAPFANDSTYWINCDTYNVCDSMTLSSGDGWKIGNYIDGYFKWEGCRAWNYSDDGFDPSGAGERHFENCWAMSTNKYIGLGAIEGNGFKTAGIGDDQAGHFTPGFVFASFRNCIAADCEGYGFYLNLETEDAGDSQANPILYNNTSYSNYSGFFDVFNPSIHGGVARNTFMRNNLAYNNSSSNYEQCGIYRPSIYTESNNTWVATQLTGDPSWPGWEYNSAVTVTGADFVSLVLTQIYGARQSDGSLPVITLLTLAASSDLIDAGVDVGLPYSGDAPDMGYAEYDLEGGATTPFVSTNTNYWKNVIQVNTGGTVTNDGGAAVTARGICWSTGANPDLGDNVATSGSGEGSFTLTITGLVRSTTYHLRAYATNSVGTSYGDDIPVTTSASSSGNSGGKIAKINGKRIKI